MTPATEARLGQIIELSRKLDTHTTSIIRELAERALLDERAHSWDRLFPAHTPAPEQLPPGDGIDPSAC